MSSTGLLPVNTPQLNLDGTNGAIFLMRFRETMQTMQHWGHFNGMRLWPSPSHIDKPTKAKIEAMGGWDHRDTAARYLLSQCLPGSTTLHLSTYPMAKAR